jgi:D-serine deaminase-like pyridoxal phosphate-dependent protein
VILDLAVAALVVVVLGSLAMLAWTLAVSSVAATRNARRRVADARQLLHEREVGLHRSRLRAQRQIDRLAERVRTTPGDR